MWRTGLGFSPSRARRAAVSASSGMPSEPVAISAWLTPARRYIAWSVRTWRSSPECELAMSAISGGSRSNASIPPASIRATTPNGLTQLRRFATRSGSPRPRIRRAVDIDLDDVAAVDALLDPAAHLADEDRGRPAGPGAPRGGRARRGDGAAAGAAVGRRDLDGRHGPARIARRSRPGSPAIGPRDAEDDTAGSTANDVSRALERAIRPVEPAADATLHGRGRAGRSLGRGCDAADARRRAGRRPCYDLGTVDRRFVAATRPSPGGPS